MTDRRSLLVQIGLFAVRRPWTVLFIGAAGAALSLLAILRIQATGSLDSMLAQDESSRALSRVMGDFGVIDELILLVTAPDSAGASAESVPLRLGAFAERLTKEIEQSADLSALCDDVIFGPPAAMRSFLKDHALPSALLYVHDDTFAQMRERFTSANIRAQMQRNEELLSAPGVAGHTIAKEILKDPLRLHEPLIRELAKRFPAADPSQADHLFLSKDGRTLMIRIAGARPASDLEFSKTITASMSKLATHLRETEPQPTIGDSRAAKDREPLQIEFTGAYAIAVTAERSIRRDFISSTTSSIVFLFLLFLLVYRSATSFLFAIIPVCLGILMAFGISSLYFTQLTPVVAAIGAMLAGLAIDYSIHFISLFAKEQARGAGTREAVGRTLDEVASAMTAACLTSIIGFLAISLTPVSALRQFAVIGALGLGVSLLAAVALLPAMFCLSPRPMQMKEPRLLRSTIVPLVRWVIAHPRACAYGVAAATLLLAAPVIVSPSTSLRWDHDLSVMHPRPNRPLELQHEIARRFGFDPDAFLIHLEAPNADQLLTLAHRVDQALRSDEVRAGGIVSIFGPASLLPNPQIQDHRMKEIAALDADRIISDLRGALAESLFDPAAFEPYIQFLRRFLSPAIPPNWNTLHDHPALARLVLPTATWKHHQSPSQALVIASADQPLVERSRRDQAIAAIRKALHGLSGATLTGVSVVGHDTESRIYGNLSRLLIVSNALVLVYLTFFYKSATRAALSMLPMFVGLVCVAACMSLLGMGLNMVNLIGLPILVGIGVDVGIFLVSLAESAKRQQSTRSDLIEKLSVGSHSLLMTTLATVLGFGTLAMTSTPAMQSLGIILTVGITGCLVAATFLLVPILTLTHKGIVPISPGPLHTKTPLGKCDRFEGAFDAQNCAASSDDLGN